MNAKQQTINRVIEEQEDSWGDANFQPRDESVINRARFGDESTTDPMFAPLASDAPMSLRNQLTRMVRDSANDPELKQQLQSAGVNLPKTAWTFYSQGWKVDTIMKDGWWIVSAKNEKTGEDRHFRLQDAHSGDRDEAMAAIGRVLNRNVPRTVSESDTIRLQRMALSGSPQLLEDALGELIMKRLPADAAAELEQTGDIDTYINAVRFQPLYRQCVLDVWCWSRPHCDPNDAEWAAYLQKHSVGRLLNFAVLDGLWNRFQMGLEEKSRERLLGFGQTAAANEAEQVDPEAVTESIDKMTDEEVERLRAATLREYSRQRAQKQVGA